MDIKVLGLSKTIKKQVILSDVDLTFSGIYGLLGPNGAGKTTMMKILAGLEPFSTGSVTADEEVIHSKTYVKRTNLIGYLPQDFMIYPDLMMYDVLEHIAILQGENKQAIPTKIKEVLLKVNLQKHSYKKMKELSGGMRRRVGIAQLLLRNPSILLFDEPTAGLDIEERIRFRNLLKQLGSEHTVIISSHLVEDIEFLCTKIGVIRQGIVLFEGSPYELKQKAIKHTYEMTVNYKELDEIIASKEVVQMDDYESYVKIRVLSDLPEGDPVPPKLIDGYLVLLKEAQNV